MNLEEMRTRLAEVETEMREMTEAAVETPELEAMEQRSEELINERAKLIAEIETAEKKAEEERAAEAEALKAKTVIESQEETKVTNKEIRNSKEYIEAYAEYIKTGDDRQCRSLLTENASGGTVPVPEFVEGRIRTAWDNDAIIGRIGKTFFKGNVKFGFEISGTDAAVHTEGTREFPEEVLTLGIVNMVPETVKKWITFSDEVMDLNGEAFLDYIYDEITHKIVKKMADMVVYDIIHAPTTSSSTAPAVPTLVDQLSPVMLIAAASKLADEATAPVIIMKKSTYVAFKGLQMQASYAVDPFDGMTVLFNDTLGELGNQNQTPIAIVGDLANGYKGNFPVGDEVKFVYDDKSLAEDDLVKVVGRLPFGHGVVAPNHFCNVIEQV